MLSFQYHPAQMWSVVVHSKSGVCTLENAGKVMKRKERSGYTYFQIQVWLVAPGTSMIFATSVLALGRGRSSPQEVCTWRSEFGQT